YPPVLTEIVVVIVLMPHWPLLVRPTVSLGVTSAVVDTCGRDDGRIAPTHCALIDGRLGGRWSRYQGYRTPPSATRSARCTHAGAPRQTPTAAPEEVPHSGSPPRAGTPRWPHTGGETT